MISEMFTQLSILFFYLRVFDSTLFRKCAIGISVFVVCFGVANTFSMIFQCTPISFFWNGWTGEYAGKCININAFSWIRAAIEIIIDLAIISLPIPLLLGLKLKWHKKLQILSMFSIGFLWVAFPWPICQTLITPRVKTNDHATVLHSSASYDLSPWYDFPNLLILPVSHRFQTPHLANIIERWKCSRSLLVSPWMWYRYCLRLHASTSYHSRSYLPKVLWQQLSLSHWRIASNNTSWATTRAQIRPRSWSYHKDDSLVGYWSRWSQPDSVPGRNEQHRAWGEQTLRWLFLGISITSGWRLCEHTQKSVRLKTHIPWNSYLIVLFSVLSYDRSEVHHPSTCILS